MKWHKVFIYVILNVKHEKIPIYRGCNLIVVHCWWRHRPTATLLPIKYTSSFWKDQRFSTESKIVLKYCNISKILARGSINSPPGPLYHVGGMNLRVRPRVKKMLEQAFSVVTIFSSQLSRTLLANCNIVIVTLLYWAHWNYDTHHVINSFSPSHLTVLGLWFQTPPFPHWVDEGPMSR